MAHRTLPHRQPGRGPARGRTTGARSDDHRPAGWRAAGRGCGRPTAQRPGGRRRQRRQQLVDVVAVAAPAPIARRRHRDRRPGPAHPGDHAAGQHDRPVGPTLHRAHGHDRRERRPDRLGPAPRARAPHTTASADRPPSTTHTNDGRPSPAFPSSTGTPPGQSGTDTSWNTTHNPGRSPSRAGNTDRQLQVRADRRRRVRHGHHRRRSRQRGARPAAASVRSDGRHAADPRRARTRRPAARAGLGHGDVTTTSSGHHSAPVTHPARRAGHRPMRIGIIAPPWAPVPPGPLRRHRAHRRPAGDRVPGARPRRPPVHHRRQHLRRPPPSPPRPGRGQPRMGHSGPELRHVLAAYEAMREWGADIVHDHTLAGPVHAADSQRIRQHAGGHDHAQPVRRTSSPTSTAGSHEQVPLIAISHAQRRPVPDLPIARVIHHGLGADDFPVGDGTDGGDYCLFLGRMSPDKGAAPRHGGRLQGRRPAASCAPRCASPGSSTTSTSTCGPYLNDDIQYLGEVPHERKLELLAGARALLFPIRWNEPFGMVIHRGDGLRHAGARLPRGRRPRDRRARPDRLPLRRRRRPVRGHRPHRPARPRRLPGRGRGLLLDGPDGARAHRAVRDARPSSAASTPQLDDVAVGVADVQRRGVAARAPPRHGTLDDVERAAVAHRLRGRWARRRGRWSTFPRTAGSRSPATTSMIVPSFTAHRREEHLAAPPLVDAQHLEAEHVAVPRRPSARCRRPPARGGPLPAWIPPRANSRFRSVSEACERTISTAGSTSDEERGAVIPDIDLDHVAVAVERQADALAALRRRPPVARWIGGGGTAGFWSAQVQYANGMKVEVLEPYLVEQNDFLRRFLDRNGPGPHHLTFKVKDIRGALRLAEDGRLPAGRREPGERVVEGGVPPPEGRARGRRAARPVRWWRRRRRSDDDWGDGATPDWFPAATHVEQPATLVHVGPRRRRPRRGPPPVRRPPRRAGRVRGRAPTTSRGSTSPGRGPVASASSPVRRWRRGSTDGRDGSTTSRSPPTIPAPSTVRARRPEPGRSRCRPTPIGASACSSTPRRSRLPPCPSGKYGSSPRQKRNPSWARSSMT